MICVPLFMILSGYLIHTKAISKKYYCKLTRILFAFAVSSVLCGLYYKFVIDSDVSIGSIIVNTFAFKSAPYSWYIEMYIGLFLLIPFLNILYDGIETKQHKQVLIATLVAMTALPGILNIYRVAGISWWLMPSTSRTYSPIIPDWWTSIYPLTYFYIGKYLREFPIQLSNRKKLLYFILVSLAAGLFNYYRSYGSEFISGSWQDYGSLLILIPSVLVFSLFADLDYSNLPDPARSVFSTISRLSLGAYLMSWIPDQFVYVTLNNAIPDVVDRMIFFPVAVLIVLLCSLLLSAGIDSLYSVLSKLFLRKKIS